MAEHCKPLAQPAQIINKAHSQITLNMLIYSASARIIIGSVSSTTAASTLCLREDAILHSLLERMRYCTLLVEDGCSCCANLFRSWNSAHVRSGLCCLLLLGKLATGVGVGPAFGWRPGTLLAHSTHFFWIAVFETN